MTRSMNRLEINLISFIPLISNVKNMYNTEASLKYFIVQVLTSATLLFIVVIKKLTEDLFTYENNPYTQIIVCTPLLLYVSTCIFIFQEIYGI
jgi:hypothetical protein